MRHVLLRVCWLLEDMVDKVFGITQGSKFYPSRYFEKNPSLGRRGKNRVASRETASFPKDRSV